MAQHNCNNGVIVTWLPDGRSFVIVDPDMFVSTVLRQKTFKGCEYASFVRKLHRWGFIQLMRETNCFFHPLFQQGRIDLRGTIQCLPHNDSIKKGPKRGIAAV